MQSAISATFGTTGALSKRRATLFNSLGVYYFCLAVVAIDSLDVLDILDNDYAAGAKYVYAAITLGFIFVYFVRWRQVSTDIAPIIFLFFFLATGAAFAINFFVYDERQSYISAFISPLVFSLALFIPPNTLVIDAGRITRQLTLLFSFGAVFYLIEAVVKPLEAVHGLVWQGEVQIHKSLICVMAICLCILTDRKALALFVSLVTVAALLLRPLSTLVLALVCCVPIAIALRSRVIRPRPVPLLIARLIAMATLLVAAGIPLLLYFFFDDVGPLINVIDGYLKTDVIGGVSNVAFRLEILQAAFQKIRRYIVLVW